LKPSLKRPGKAKEGTVSAHMDESFAVGKGKADYKRRKTMQS
jgi:hypothetical protein